MKSFRAGLAAALAAAVSASGVGAVAAARAASDPEPVVTWAVSPADESGPDGRAWIELEAAAGSMTAERMVVRNLGQADAVFKLSAADGYFNAKGRFGMLSSGQPSTDAGTWIDIQPQVEVPAGEEAVVEFTIAVPANATPGDHPAGVAASVLSTATSDDGGAQLGVESRIGFRVIIRVTGELRPELAVDGAKASYQLSWNPFKPGRMTVQYEAANTGNVQLGFTDQVSGGEPAERGDLFPGESRAVVLDVGPAWPLFRNRVELTVTPAISGLAADEAADEAAGGGPAVAPVTLSLRATAIPWPQLLVLLGLALVTASLLAGRRRSRARIGRLVAEAVERGRSEALQDREGGQDNADQR